MDVESDGTTTQTCNHGPGCSRYNGSIPPWESQWDINGPDGSPKWTVGNDGKMTHYHGYSTLGNNIQEEQYNGASAQPPRSMGGDQRTRITTHAGTLALLEKLNPAAGTPPLLPKVYSGSEKLASKCQANH